VLAEGNSHREAIEVNSHHNLLEYLSQLKFYFVDPSFEVSGRELQ